MRTISITTILYVLVFTMLPSSQEMKWFGGIWQGNPENNFKEYFNQVTPENAGKWGVVNYGTLDAMYSYAEENNFLTKQHTFVWGNQTRPGSSKQDVENWIRDYMQRYGDKVDLIDVVNEPLHRPPDYTGNLGGSGESGWDWVLWCFETARKYAPNAKLLVNDYHILTQESSTQKYYDLINVLKTEGNIDGIGLQAHFLEGTSGELVQKNLDKLAELKLPIYISEFELDIGNDDQHNEKMQELFPVFWQHPMVVGVTHWGYKQGNMWRDNGYLVKSNGQERPAMRWLMKYLEDNPLPQPGSTTEEPLCVANFNQSNNNRFSRIFLGGDISSLVPQSNVRIYGMDGKLINDFTSRNYVTGNLARMPFILIEK